MTSQTLVTKIWLLTLGWEQLPKSVSVFGSSNDKIREPVPAIVVESSTGFVLIDTGFNTALIRDPALYRRYYPSSDHVPILPQHEEPLLKSLRDIGLDAADISAVAISHLHSDHCGGLKLFADGTPVFVQRRELEYGLSGDPDVERNGIYRVDFDDPRLNWQITDGEGEIAPGVRALPTSGHTPGHQSFEIEFDESVGGGGMIFAFDAADLAENIDRLVSPGGLVHSSPEDAVRAIQRLKQRAARSGFSLIPGHDPGVWPSLTVELAERFGTTMTET